MNFKRQIGEMDLYKCAYRDPRSPLTPINPINTQYCQCSALKSASNYSATPLSSKASASAKAVGLCEPSESTRYYTLVPQRTASSTTPQNAQKVLRRKVTEEVHYQRGKVVKISRCEQQEKIIFKRASPRAKPLCPKVAEWLKSIGLERYKNLFKDEEIDYKALLLMDEDDLKDLEIHCPRDRTLLLNLIRRKKDYWNFN